MKRVTQVKLTCLVALVSASAGLAPLSATEVYTWKDENGVVHYTDVPPDRVDTQQMTVEGVYKPGTVGIQETPPAGESEPEESPLSAAQQRRERIAAEREQRQEEQALTDAMCQRHRQRLAQMEPARRVMVTNEAGETTRLDDDQRMGLIDESKEFIARNCE